MFTLYLLQSILLFNILSSNYAVKTGVENRFNFREINQDVKDNVGNKMDQLVCVEDFEKEAYKILDRNALEYYKSGADAEVTLAENKNAYKRLIIRPRMLRNSKFYDLTTNVLGKKVSFPIGISPTSFQKLAHEDGEIGTSTAAASMGTIFILSTASTTSLEDVARANPRSRKWLQLYILKDRNETMQFIRRGESSGFQAIVLTADTPILGKRRASIRHHFRLPSYLSFANFQDGRKGDCLEESQQCNDPIEEFNKRMDSSLVWKDVDWLKTITNLPIIVKGILTAEDSKIAISHGVAGIFVSNHGGRQLDTVHATIDVLEEVVHAVNGRCDIYIDGGVTVGTDVFKALALGATMVFSGRPFLWGLAVGGEEGAKRVLEILKEELNLTMALAGVNKIGNIKRNSVTKLPNW